MKKIALLITIASFAVCACNKIESASEDLDCIVSLNLIGEIETSEDPLTKAEGSTGNLYAVQVYQGNDVFAWGIFDNLKSQSVALKQGNTYSIVVVKVDEAKTLLGSYYSLTNDGIYAATEYVGPFYVGMPSYYYLRTNKFFYTFQRNFEYYENATSTSVKSYTGYTTNLSKIDTGSLLKVSYPSCTDWLYGKATGFTADGTTATCNIPLRRVGFKLKYELEGVTDGSVTVTIKNNTRKFFERTTTTPSYSSETLFIAFSDTASAWQYADNYMENMTVSVSWARGIGVTQALGSKVVSIKRNCLNKIKISLGNDDRAAGVSLTTEDDTTMGTAGNNIVVQ